MTAERMAQGLEAVGVGPHERALYGAVLERPGRTAHELAQAAGAPVARVRRGLARLEDLGLVSRAPGTPRRYVPTLPDAAIEALLHGREQALEQARLAAADLTALYHAASPRGPASLLEVVDGREAVARRFLQLQKRARERVDVFDAPPYATPANVAEAGGLRRGVRYRAIYAAPALEDPAKLDAVLDMVALGEEARVLPSVPVKLAVADASLALMAASLDADRLSEGAVVVHASPLLEALQTLFALLWERATPIRMPLGSLGGVVGEPPAGATSELDDVDVRVLALLTAGCKDEAIARQLGTSPRTVRRRVRRILEQLGASTRFQAGLQAARRGWL